MSSGPKNITQTTRQVMSPQQNQLLQAAMPGFLDFVKNPPQLPGFSGIAPFNPAQLAGQQLALGAAGRQGTLAGDAGAASRFLMGDVLFPGSNPALQQTIAAATRPIQENFLERVMPAIGTEAIQAGQFGGARQGIAQGIAARETQRQIGDTSAKIATDAYQGGLDALVKGLGLMPQTMQAQAMPATTVSGVGDVQQALQQARLSEQLQRFNWQQMAPLLAAKELAGAAAGLPGGSTVSSAPATQANPWLQAAGGGLSLLSALSGGGGAAAGGALAALPSFLAML